MMVVVLVVDERVVIDGARWEEDLGVVVGRRFGFRFGFVDGEGGGGESSSESLMVIMLGVFLWPLGRPMLVLVAGVAGGVRGDDESEVTTVVAGVAGSGILHGFFILSAFCHLLHCHSAG